MPMLENLARADAMFGATGMYDTSTVSVEIPAIKVEKTSDALNGVWIGDVLTYTITITNLDDTVTATDLSFTDTINPNLAKLVLTSVKVDGTTLTAGEDFTYEPVTGKLDIPNPLGSYSMPDILPTESYTVTFQVTKA